MSRNIGLIIRYESEDWKIMNEGTCSDGKIYCHLANLIRGRKQKNGFYPIQICAWIDQDIISEARNKIS